VLRVDSASVFSLEFIGGLDTALKGTILSKLSLHLLVTFNGVVLANVVLFVGHGCTAGKTIITGLRHWGCTVLAQIVVGAGFKQVVSDVLLARTVGDTMVEGVLVNESGVTTIAATAGIAVDNGLGVQTNGSGVLQVVQDVESVSEGTGGTLGPA